MNVLARWWPIYSGTGEAPRSYDHHEGRGGAARLGLAWQPKAVGQRWDCFHLLCQRLRGREVWAALGPEPGLKC